MSLSPIKNRAIFLDRDGVINEIIFHQEVGLLETPFTEKQFRLRAGIPNAVRKFKQLGFKVIVVSNQPGVAMRHFSQRTLKAITKKMVSLLKKRGAHLDGIYYCIHHPTKGIGFLKKRCSCRKPKTGLLLKSARMLAIDLKRSYMVGDSITDVETGKRAGCKTFLLAHLKCDLCHLMAKRGIKPDYLADNLLDVTDQIERLEKSSGKEFT